MKPAVVNASPIIVLGRAGYLAAATQAQYLPDFANTVQRVIRAGLYVDAHTVAAIAERLRSTGRERD